MSRLDNILNDLNVAEKPDTAEQSSDAAIPLSFIAHNEMIVRNAERALSQLASLDNTKVFIKNPDGTTIRLQAGCKISYLQYIGGE
jgi:hypothetical protein